MVRSFDFFSSALSCSLECSARWARTWYRLTKMLRHFLCWQRAGRELKRKIAWRRILIILNSANIELMSGTYDSVHRWKCHIRHESYYIYSTIKIHDGWGLPGCNECDTWLQNAIAANWVDRERRKCVIAVVLVIVMMFKSCIHSKTFFCDQKSCTNTCLIQDIY